MKELLPFPMEQPQDAACSEAIHPPIHQPVRPVPANVLRLESLQRQIELPCSNASELENKPATTKLIHLTWDHLQPFEAVQHQFQEWGVTFTNAIALTPSNPAYPLHHGAMLLMDAPYNGYIDVQFETPVQSVTGLVTGSRRTVMTAFDSAGRAIATASTPGPNLETESGACAPNLSLSVVAVAIQRVRFQTFDGHLTLSELHFCH